MKTREEILKSIAKGNKDAGLKVISLGLGVQSTAVYLMSSMEYKMPRADVAVFADPGAEHEKTYDILDWLLEWKDKNDGIELIVNRDRNLYQDIMDNAPLGKRFASIPAHTEERGIIRRQCTEEYKIMPVKSSIRKIYGLKPKKRMKPTEMWLGISLDEIQRMKQSSMYNIEFFYPLIYNGMDRKDCIKFFKKNDFPVPIKSSCVFCPYHSNDFWKDLKKNKNAWDMALEVDRAIRVNPLLRQKLYIHSQCKPLDEVDLTDNQLTMEGFECEGHCGL